MHLEATCDLTVRWPGGERAFKARERIHTECSYKYDSERLDAVVGAAGFHIVERWSDERDWFWVVLLEPR